MQLRNTLRRRILGRWRKQRYVQKEYYMEMQYGTISDDMGL